MTVACKHRPAPWWAAHQDHAQDLIAELGRVIPAVRHNVWVCCGTHFAVVHRPWTAEELDLFNTTARRFGIDDPVGTASTLTNGAP